MALKVIIMKEIMASKESEIIKVIRMKAANRKRNVAKMKASAAKMA
jgi:hypothetical protein